MLTAPQLCEVIKIRVSHTVKYYPLRSSLTPTEQIKWFRDSMPAGSRLAPVSMVLIDWAPTPCWIWWCSAEPVPSPSPRSTNLVRTTKIYLIWYQKKQMFRQQYLVASLLTLVLLFSPQGRNCPLCSPMQGRSLWPTWTSWGLPMEVWEPLRSGSTCRRYTHTGKILC